MDNTGLMRPGPTIAAAEDDERRRRESGLLGLMAAISEPLMYAPNPLISGAASVANRIGTDGWQTGLASGAADLAMNLAVQNGPQKLGAMIPASKVGGKWLEHFRHLLAGGTPRDKAHLATRSLPMLNKRGQLLKDDLWVPATRMQPKLSDEVLDAKHELVRGWENAQRHGKETFHLEDVYAKGELDKLLQAMPELAKTKVTLTTGLKPHEGELNQFGEIRVGAQTPLSGPDNLVAVLGHENTHKIQRELGLPGGGSPLGTFGAKVRAREEELLRYVYGGGPMDEQAIREEAVNKLKKAADTVEPGTSPRIVQGLDPALQKIALLLGWENRQQRELAPKDPDYKHYRGLHGEQIAEGGGRHANALPIKFTTPLAKQIVTLEDLETGNYQLRMQRLYDAIQAGQFPDPKKFPYEHFPY